MIDQLFQLMAMIHLRVKTQIYFCVAQPQFPVLKLCTDHSTDLIHALMSFPGNKGRSHLNMGHRHGKTVWGAWYNDTCDCAATGPKSTTVPCRFFDQTSYRNETHRVICDVIHLNWNLDHTSKTPNQRLLHDSFHACSNGWETIKSISPITPAKPSLEHGYRWNRSIQYEAAPLKRPPSVCAQAWKMQAALLLIILSSIT